jgi:hypothetical protein
MVECVMHIGAGKCGSSSLQTRLSENPWIKASDGKAYEYICLKENRRILNGHRCQNAAAKNAHGYTASTSVNHFFTPESCPRLRNGLRKVIRPGRVSLLARRKPVCTPILSYEGWLHEGSKFADWNVLERLGLEAKIVMFIRPQTEWINASWWQWGAWSNESFPKWLHRWKTKGRWAEAAQQWKNVPGVTRVDVFTVTQDVVSTFFRYLNAPPPQPLARTNSALDGNLLRYLQRHKDLRAGTRESAFHFILGRHLENGPAATPWVLSQDLVSELIEFYREDNECLLALVDEKTRAEISSDLRWWSPSAYSDRPAESPGAVPLQPAQVEDVAKRAIHAIIDLDNELRGR